MRDGGTGGRRLLESARMLLEMRSEAVIIFLSAILLSLFVRKLRELAMGDGIVSVGAMGVWVADGL